jgi:hypothetical protein
VDHEVILFMDGFFGYNHIQISIEDYYKTSFTTPRIFTYKVMPFGLKNVGATFQWAMSYYFHELFYTILEYLDDLTTHSKKLSHHLRIFTKLSFGVARIIFS